MAAKRNAYRRPRIAGAFFFCRLRARAQRFCAAREQTPWSCTMKKTDLLHTTVDHYDIKTVNVIPMIDMMEKTAFQARNLARAAKIVDEMVADQDCGIILTLAGSLISAGQKGIILDMMRCN